MTFCYISFATEDTFLGGLVVEADTPEKAEANRLGLNPGGEAAIWVLPHTREEIPLAEINRLMSKEELGEELEGEEREYVMTHVTRICQKCGEGKTHEC